MARKRSASHRHFDAPRHPNGRIYHRKSKADQAPPRPYYAYAHRLRHDPENAEILLIAAATPERKLYHRVSKEALMKAITAAEDRRMGYPLGVLWARGLLCPAPDSFETAAEKEARAEEAELLDKAGRLYAAQHYVVWRWQGSPCQDASSHLERTMAENGIDVRPPTELDPEQIEEQRLTMKASLEGARRALMRAAPMGLALKAVDRICIDAFGGDVHPGPLARLRDGLEALKEYYNVRVAKPRDRAADRPAAEPVSAREGHEPVVAARRNIRPRLPANLTSDPALRPALESVAASVAALLKEGRRRPSPPTR